jgi:hypothetical protein
VRVELAELTPEQRRTERRKRGAVSAVQQGVDDIVGARARGVHHGDGEIAWVIRRTLEAVRRNLERTAKGQ